MTSVLDYQGYLDFLRVRNHNFIRLWSFQGFSAGTHWVVPPHYYEPLPYARSGRDAALDGKPRVDLKRFNDEYFHRLRSRVSAARELGLYVAVMLFQGWSVESRAAWQGHPFNVNNNVNGIDGDSDNNGTGQEIYSLRQPAITALQEAYVRRVVDSVNDLDNVVYEVGNEIGQYSTEWQYHIIRYVKAYEAGMPRQHPVGMTFQVPQPGQTGNDSSLFESPADWISPGRASAPYDWVSSPPPADGRKVIVSDTDHFDPQSRTQAWVWKTFLRGLHPILMDDPKNTDRMREATRRAMGYTLMFADRIDLGSMVPRPDLASSGYCLANDGVAYLIYLPSESAGNRLERLYRAFTALFRGAVTVDVSAAPGRLAVEWFNPSTGETIDGGTSMGGARQPFRAPFRGDAVLYIFRHREVS